MPEFLAETPRPLQSGDPVADFNCGVEELNRYLQRFAWPNQQANAAVTYGGMTLTKCCELELPQAMEGLRLARINRDIQQGCGLRAGNIVPGVGIRQAHGIGLRVPTQVVSQPRENQGAATEGVRNVRWV